MNINSASKYIILFLVLFIQGCVALDFNGKKDGCKPPLPMFKNVKVALVLGGGGVRGLAHVAVIEELERVGIKPDLIVGCSAGAIVGALYADSLNIQEVKKNLFKQNRSTLFDIALSHLPFSLSKGIALQSFLESHIKARKFEDLKIPFVVVATSLEFGEKVVFGEGPLVPAVKASASYPGVFMPVNIGGHYYTDGGVVDPVPVGVARKLGAEYVIAVDLSGDLTTSAPTNLFGIAQRSLEISYLHLSKYAVKKADHIIHIPFRDIGSFDDGINELVYDLGKIKASVEVDDIKQDLKNRKLLAD